MKAHSSPAEWEHCELTWSEHTLLGKALLCGEILVDPQNLVWEILTRAPSWAYYWQSRQEKSPEWGVGATLILDESQIAEALESTDLSFFGGAPFDASHSDKAVWGEFAEAFWILPQLSGKQLNDGLRLRFFTYASDRNQARDEFFKCLASTLFSGSEQWAEIPKYLERLDIPSREAWEEKILLACSRIASADLDKVVMSRSVELSFEGEVPWVNCLKALQEISEESFVFALKTPSGRVFVGRSPERLLAWDAKGFAIDAIAGTRRRDESAGADLEVGQELKSSRKDKWEHSLVRQAVESLLQKFAEHYELVSDQELLVLRYVQHMRTRFQASWKDGLVSGWELLQALHPTPAVGGCPTELAKDFIREHEGFVRGWFAGYIGTVSRSSAELAIGIRSALFRQNKLTVFAGAGIVAGSDPTQEWLETEFKMQNFLRLFQKESPYSFIEADVPWAETPQSRTI